MERKMAQPNAGDEPLLVSRVVETKVVEQKQILEPGREKVDVLADRLAPIQRLESQRRAKPRKPCYPPRRGSESCRLNTLNTRSGARLKGVRLPRRSEKSSMRYGQQLTRPRSSKGRRLIKNETGQTPLRANLAPSGRNSIRRGS